jgi:hypothetical protein
MGGASPPGTARNLILQLVRTQAQAQACPSCKRPLTGCSLSVRTVEVDHILVEAGCAFCSHVFTLRVTPLAEEGTASII